jgi:hypothetical protein
MTIVCALGGWVATLLPLLRSMPFGIPVSAIIAVTNGLLLFTVWTASFAVVDFLAIIEQTAYGNSEVVGARGDRREALWPGAGRGIGLVGGDVDLCETARPACLAGVRRGNAAASAATKESRARTESRRWKLIRSYDYFEDCFGGAIVIPFLSTTRRPTGRKRP